MKQPVKPAVKPMDPPAVANASPTTMKPAEKRTPGRNAFCDSCMAYSQSRKTCHLLPPKVNNSWFSGRAQINDPKTEWCAGWKEQTA